MWSMPASLQRHGRKWRKWQTNLQKQTEYLLIEIWHDPRGHGFLIVFFSCLRLSSFSCVSKIYAKILTVLLGTDG